VKESRHHQTETVLKAI